MSNGLLNLGTRALLVNQTALQTAGNNIANVNTPGYSRQTVVMQPVQGQFTGGGYVGKGVELVTIERAFNQFLTKQAAQTQSIASMDATRASQMMSLEDLFPTGSAGIGSSVNEMLNSLSDVASSPTDLTARAVVIQRADEMATRFRTLSSKLDDLSYGAQQQMRDSVNAINGLSTRITALNDQIARSKGSGQSPNDLLDARDKLIQDLGAYVQVTTVEANDGTLGVFVGSQPLVLGTSSSNVSMTTGDFSDTSKMKLSINNGGLVTTIDENTLGGGSVAGLLRFNNSDLTTARNLVGRLALALETTVNAQHQLGIDMNGNTGRDFFVANELPLGLPAATNNGNADIAMSVTNASAMVPSEYELRVGTLGAVDVIRLSDGQVSSFAGPMPVTMDGITFSVDQGTAQAGDRFLLKPFSTAAAQLKTAFTSASALAVASPVEAIGGTTNTGTLTVQGVQASSANANLTSTVTLTFTAAGTFDVVGAGTGNPTGVGYVPNQPISYNGWDLVVKGTPQVGDTITVQIATPGYSSRDGGNAAALMDIRDMAMFDGATVADGYAGAMSKIGILTQGAKYAADVSSSIASSAATDKASVVGVNLDEEAAKLLQFQQAYQASAKMIQIAQAIFDSLINGIR